METLEGIKFEVERLSKLWNEVDARRGKFGNAINRVTIQNIRGINSSIEFMWPVVAIGGTNGSGKSTILQICSSAYNRLKLERFIPKPIEGETPAVELPASISFEFLDDTGELTINYLPEEVTRWKYPEGEHPDRKTVYINTDKYPIKRVRQFFNHSLKEDKAVEVSALKAVCNILGMPYGGLKILKVYSGRSGTIKLKQVTRNNKTYSEYHMGLGERKIIELVLALEKLPVKSLILIEEPEVGLHSDAQRGLMWYLMNLSYRMGHQIIISTHSAEVFEILPQEARILLIREKPGVQILQSASYLKAAHELSISVRTNQNIILVEDDIAQVFLKEILFMHNRDLLKSCAIVPIGDKRYVQKTVAAFRENEVHCIAVRDPDVGENEELGLLSLPGDKAPETLLLESENLERAERFINGIQKIFEVAQIEGLDKQGSQWSKKVFDALASELRLEKTLLINRLILAWFSDSDNNEAAKALIQKILKAFENI